MDLFNINISSRAPGAGKMLVAEPFLRESFFNHAVIAMIDCDPDKPSMGVVMNQETGHTLDTLVEDISVQGIPVYCGGPMSCDRLYYIHTLGPDILPGAGEISPGLWIGGDFKSMCGYVEAGYPLDGLIRFFIGYSGWERGQLDGEMEQKVWAVADMPQPPSRLLSTTGDAQWHEAVRSLGSPYRTWLYHPRDLRAN